MRRRGVKATFQIVRGDEHAELMRLARETATKSIMAGGDRLGVAAQMLAPSFQ